MTNLISTVDPFAYTPIATGNKFRRGTMSVMFRHVCMVFRWTIRAVLGHKLYFSSLTVICTLCGLSWWIGIHRYYFSILNISPSVNCQVENDLLLRNTSALELANSATATTLMALLPALLILAPFPTAQISSVIVFSTSAALLTSAFTLGLATSSVSTLPKNRIFRVIDLCTPATIRSYASVGDPGRALDQLYLPSTVAKHNPTDIDLVPQFQRAIVGAVVQVQNFNTLRDIMFRAVFDSGRATRIQLTVMEVGFFLIQTGLMYLLINVVPSIVDIDMFWLCAGKAQIVLPSWVGIMVVLTGIIRTFAASPRISKDEILHLRPLPASYIFERCEQCTSIPPVTGPTAPPKSPYRNTFTNIRQSIHDHWAYYLLLSRRSRAVQQSSHAMVVVLQQSSVRGGPLPNTNALLYGVLCGFFQAVVLIILTVLFGSTYNGDMLLVAMLLVAFLSLVVISRTYSVYFCSWMERAFDHILIEYDTPAQLNAIRTIISGMPSVSVHNLTTGRNYRAGILVNPDCVTRHSLIVKARTKRVQAVTTGLAGVAVAVFMVVVNLSLTAFLGTLYLYWSSAIFYTIMILFSIFLVTEKLSSDFEFVDTHWDSLEIGPEVTSPV